MHGEREKDKAGQEYWNETWDSHELPRPWNLESADIFDYVDQSMYQWISDNLERLEKTGPTVTVVEVGCARSRALPALAKYLHVKVAGIDYSPNGCEQTRVMLDREGIEAEVYCSDIFSIPDELKSRFDVVISFGLIEHFTDTAEIVSALRSLLKPGGVIMTNIPNMNGLTGYTQKLLNRTVYDIHVPLTAEQVRDAHHAAGLDVITSEYFLPNNFGVVNIGEIKRSSPVWWVRRILLAILLRVSAVAWLIDRSITRLPTSRAFSPYINCTAVLPR